MALPRFTLTGNLKDILPNDGSGDLGEDALSSARVELTSNLPSDTLVTFDGVAYPADLLVLGRVATDGSIVDEDGDALLLLAEDDGLNVTGLQWRILITIPASIVPPRKYRQVRPWWISAGEDGDTIDLQTVMPVPGTHAIGVLRGPAVDDVQYNSGTGNIEFYVQGAVVGTISAAVLLDVVIDGAPGALDTLNELAAALGDDANFAATITTTLAGKQPLDTDLTAIAALASAANKVPYSTGSGTWALADFTSAARSLVDDADPTAQRATIGIPIVSTIAALKALTVSADGRVRVLGYYAAGDGGGGVFRWDSTDTTSTDNGGTIITPTGGLSSSGRWKRVYEGAVNARWFGVDPGQADNTAQLQAAVNWVSIPDINSLAGGTIFIPRGYYRFKFDQGTSGLSTITITTNYVYIRGEGAGTFLALSRTGSTDLDYFFTFTKTQRGQGGGISDLLISGGSLLKWGISLSLWRNMTFENISFHDVHGGLIDAAANSSVDVGTATLGEDIRLRNIDYICSSATNSCLPQYGIRFRSSATCSWSDCFIHNAFFVGVWDTGVLLDGVSRFDVRNVRAGWDGTSSNTIDGSPKTGTLHGVHLANTLTGAWSNVAGEHLVDNVYMESHEGSETPDVYTAVLIDIDSGITGYNQWNVIRDITVSWGGSTLGPGLLRIENNTGVDGRVNANKFYDNLMPTTDVQGLITIGTNVRNTQIYLSPNKGQLGVAVNDSGLGTYINNVGHKAFDAGSSLWPNVTPGSLNSTDAGQFVVDSTTGRVVLQDRYNDSHLIGPRPGLDVVAPYGPQRIQAMPNPTVPVVVPAPQAVGSTSYSYYVVGIDKDGNKTVPSSAGSTSTGPATLSSTAYNWVNWQPIPGAVKYDLLRGSTATSIATNLVATHFKDTGASTSVYSPAGSNPTGTLAVDGTLTASSTIELGHASDTTLSRIAAGRLAVEGVEVSRTPDIQTFTASGTWTKPTGAKTVKVLLVGPGGGGGAGAREPSGTASCGGGSAGAGAVTQVELEASLLTATVAVTVGTGGAGGAAQTTNGTAGASGSSGSGSTLFGAYAAATRGTLGGGGGAGVAGTAGGGGGGTSAGGSGIASSATGGAGSAAGSAACGGGGSGGGVTTAGTAGAGGAGGASPVGNTLGGTAGTAPGGAGTTPVTNTYFGGGGGGGGGATAAAGGTGGDGAIPGGGGGGGGGSVDGNNSGAGGAGGRGLAVVTTYF